MARFSSNDARVRWAALLDEVRTEAVHVTRRGRDVAVLVDPDFYERALVALEDAADIAAAQAARADDAPTVIHEELLRELGIAD